MTRLFAATIALFGILALAAPTASLAQSGRVQIEIAKAGLIVGVQTGRGTLTYKGRRYPLSVGGVSVGATAGASRALLVGTVRNLRRVSDIAGPYAAAEAGLAIVTGGKAARLRNARGVLLELRGHQVGLELSLDLSGMEIALR
jgi:hypothetical protein